MLMGEAEQCLGKAGKRKNLQKPKTLRGATARGTEKKKKLVGLLQFNGSFGGRGEALGGKESNLWPATNERGTERSPGPMKPRGEGGAKGM